MSTSKEYKAVRNCILNELHLTKEDIIKNIEPLLEKLVKQCMLNTYGGNNQIEHWIRCMVADELKQRDYGFVERISKEIIKDHVLNELNIIVSPKNERCVCENRVIRIGFWNGGDDFKSAHWWDYQDCYITISHCDCDDNSLFSDRIKNSIEPELWISLDVITNYLPNIKQNHLSQWLISY